MTGCIKQLTSESEPSLTAVEELTRAKQYGKAVDTVKEIQRKFPNREYSQVLNQVVEQADDYDAQQSDKINQLINTHNWYEADRALKIAQANYPYGEQLKAASERMHGRINAQVRILKAQHLLAKTEWQLRALRIQGALQNFRSEDLKLFDLLKISREDLNNTAAELYNLGVYALDNNDLDLADSCLTMSNKLNSQGNTIKAIARLDQLRFKIKQRKLLAQQEELRRHEEELLKEKTRLAKARKPVKKKPAKPSRLKLRSFADIYYKTRALLDSDQLSQVPQNLRKMYEISPADDRLKAMSTRYYNKLPTHIEALLNRGRQLYISGKIEKAREIWVKAQMLDPGNKRINENISRADRVLGRLNELKQQKKN